MSHLLKPSNLRSFLSSLNDLLQDFSKKNKEICKSFIESKNELKASYTKEKNELATHHQKKFSKLEEDFLKEKELIDVEKESRSSALTKDTEEQRTSINQSYEENSETVRRYSREFILESRKKNEESVKNLNAEHLAMAELLDHNLLQCSEIKKLLAKFKENQPSKNVISEVFEESEDGPSIEEQMRSCDASDHFDKLEEFKNDSQLTFSKLKKSPLTKLFLKVHPVLILIIITIVHTGLYFAAPKLGISLLSEKNILISFGGIFGLSALLIIFYKITTSNRLKILSANVSEIEGLCELCLAVNKAQMEEKVEKENLKLKEICEEESQKINNEVKDVDLNKDKEIRALKDSFNSTIQDINEKSASQMEELATSQTSKLEELEKISEKELNELLEKFEKNMEKISSEEQQQVDKLTDRWEKQWLSKLEEFEKLNTESQKKEKELFPSWNSDITQWQPPINFEGASQFGTLQLDLKKELTFPEGSFDLSDSIPFSIPALLEFPEAASLLAATKDEGREMAIDLIKNTVLRLLMTLPPGKARFNFIDPLSLGETFAGFMHLNDYKEELTGGRIATNSRQIEQHLADLNEHMETVIQKYLRNEFEHICDYNKEVGEIAEPFRFLVVADFPVNFSEEAVRRLVSIAKSGARCGVYVLMHQDKRHPMPGGFDISDIEKHSISIEYLFGDLDWRNCGFKLADFVAEPLPEVHAMNELIKRIGAASIDATRVEIPFSKIKNPDIWQHSSAKDISAPIGLSGAKQQLITFGYGTNQHCLIAGKTGSGKSNLIHVIISNLALKYSPDELEFYLIDFKKGVEFKPYASGKLPHAKAIAIESDREFGLSVLRKIDKDLQERGETLRKEGVQNLTQYRESGAKMSRTLLVIDEFQEIFVEDDMIAQECSLLLDRIVRQGRAFGIHVILGSQTLAGSYTLPRSTMGQMTIRIALQCSESDSYIILSENNSAARLLGRPGEAIYNDKAGLPEGNTPFQTAFLPEKEKNEILSSIKQDDKSPFIFEGNIPGSINNNKDFTDLLSTDPSGRNLLLLGEPNAIRPAQSVLFEPVCGQNMLIIGQNEESSLAIILASISSLALNHESNKVCFYIFDGSSVDQPREEIFSKFTDCISHESHIIKPNKAEEAILEIKNKMAEDKKIFLFFHGYQKFRKLKQEESFSWDDEEQSTGKTISEIFSDGPESSVHSILWCDSWNSFSRMAPRKILNDFEYRLLYQISQSDSVSLMDSPDATKLGLHTALLFNDQTGDASKFRPFALPGTEWNEKLQEYYNKTAAK